LYQTKNARLVQDVTPKHPQPIKSTPLSSRLFLALQRAEDRLLSLDTIESLMARMECGSATFEEREAAARAIEEHQKPDGSWQGSLIRTAESLLLLAQLRDGARTNDVDCAIDWVHDRCDRPGRFGDGCDPAAHGAGLCNHFVSGFFAPSPSTVSLAGLRLQDGSLIGSDTDARIAASALAGAALLRFGEDGSQLRLQLDGLTRIGERAAAGRFPLSPTAFVCIVRCLCASNDPAVVSGRTAALQQLAGSQRADGSWPGLDLFLVLDVLASATAAGQAPASVRGALENAARMLFLMQQSDGSWGRETGPSQLLAGWRALRQLAAGAPVNGESSAAAPAYGEG
jgi:hypothetical protein